jgi:hypothetical protein
MVSPKVPLAVWLEFEAAELDTGQLLPHVQV